MKTNPYSSPGSSKSSPAPNPSLSGRPLLFYDGSCGLCDRSVQFVIEHDKKKLFLFAPLQGETAKKVLAGVEQLPDSLVLVEHYNTPHQKIYFMAKGAFRVAWLLGGWLAPLGLLSFLPGVLFDWMYRLVAKYRHAFFKESCVIIKDRESFLD